MTAAVLDRALAPLFVPLDGARNAILRRFGRALAPIIGPRDTRVVALGVFGLVTAFAFTVLAPLWLLTVGPLLLGVPHLLSDLRYLVVRPGLHRRGLFALLVGLPLAATFVEPRLWMSLIAVAGAAIAARVAWRTRIIAALWCLGAAALAYSAGWVVDTAFAHAHNLVGIALWWLWRARRPASHLAIPALFLVGAGLIGWIGEGCVLRFGTLTPPRDGLDADTLALGLVPDFVDPSWALRILLLFAFAQSTHYAVWLRLIPDDGRPRAGLRSFAATYRALVADCGRPLLALALVLGIGFIVFGLVDATQARTAYLRVAMFHGPMELSVALLWALEGRRALTAAHPVEAAA